MSLPNLFLCAAPRSGSTQLARWLDTHADISLSAVKEPNYFAAEDFPPDYVRKTHLNDVNPIGPPPRPAQFAVFRDRPAYERLFAPLKAHWRLDASTSYLSCERAPYRIANTTQNAMIIILTRDPLSRALSHYRLALRTGRTSRSLAHELAEERAGTLPPGACYLLRPSLQQKGIDRFYSHFSPNNILHIRFEDMIAAPEKTLANVARFLSISDSFDLSVSARNAPAVARFSRLNQWMLRTGIKTAIRRAVPTKARPFMRNLWFRKGVEITIPDHHIAMLKHALEAE